MICFYHSGDLDGHCSGAIVRYKFPEARMIGLNYEDEFPWHEVKAEDSVAMVDFSLPMDQMDRLQRTCRQVLEGVIGDLKAEGFIWIDHHQTAIDKAQEAGFDPPGVRLVGKAACELTWEHLFPGALLPPGVFLLGRYDVRDHKNLSGCLEFQYGMRTFQTDPVLDEAMEKVWERVFGQDPLFLAETIKAGNSILNYQRQEYAKLMDRHAFYTRLDDIAVLAVNHGPGGSMKFEGCKGSGDTLSDHKLFPLLISFARLPQGKWLVNLYTFQEDVDCGEIAGRHGGGGHQKAAGFICEYLPFKI